MFKWIKQRDADILEIKKEMKEIRESQQRAEETLKNIADILNKVNGKGDE